MEPELERLRQLLHRLSAAIQQTNSNQESLQASCVARPHPENGENRQNRRVSFDFAVEVSFSPNSRPSHVLEPAQRARGRLLEKKVAAQTEPSPRRRQSPAQARRSNIRSPPQGLPQPPVGSGLTENFNLDSARVFDPVSSPHTWRSIQTILSSMTHGSEAEAASEAAATARPGSGSPSPEPS